MPFHIDQRVMTTVDIDSLWHGGFAPRAGSHGTITGTPVNGITTYGVVLDNDPDGLPTAYTADELNPA